MTSQDFGRPSQVGGQDLSLTWRLPQESHQTSQVMLHWSEKCKTYTKDWDWEWTHFWDTFVAKFGIYTEWGGSFTFGIKQEDKTASTQPSLVSQVAPTPTTVFLSPSLLEICLSWRQFVLSLWTLSLEPVLSTHGSWLSIFKLTSRNIQRKTPTPSSERGSDKL